MIRQPALGIGGPNSQSLLRPCLWVLAADALVVYIQGENERNPRGLQQEQALEKGLAGELHHRHSSVALIPVLPVNLDTIPEAFGV